MSISVFERRKRERPIEQEKPKTLTLEEVVEKLEGLKINPQEVLNVKAGRYSNAIVRGFRISVPYHDDGGMSIRIIGTYFGNMGMPEKIDYVHRFN